MSDEFEPNRDDTQYVLSCSFGKDSLACIGACQKLGWRIDRIVHAEVWATDTIPAELPDMYEWKQYAIKKIEKDFGIKTECFFSIKNGDKNTYEKLFYTTRKSGRRKGEIAGFPFPGHPECNSALKRPAIAIAEKAINASGKKTVSFVGIAIDEPSRLARLDGKRKISPLAAIGWTEADAKQWCIENDLLSPIYKKIIRGGCWFCHNQSIEQLRHLRREYPSYWKLLLKWDSDSPTTFKADGHTVHDFDRRFYLEDKGLVPNDNTFRWYMLYQHQMTIFDYIKELLD